MIYTSQLKALNKERDNVLGIIAIMAVPAPFIAIGLGMTIGGFKSGPFYLALVGLALVVLGVLIGRSLFKKVLAVKDKAYDLFQKNDVYVDPNDRKLRGVDRIALEKFGGDLKWALSYVAESPELHRRERLALMNSWCDYERDYIYRYYHKKPIEVAQASRKDPLTIQKIEEDIAKRFRKYRKEAPVFTVTMAHCTDKHHSVGIDGDSDCYYLYFGEHGRCETESIDHELARKGEAYYIVTLEGSKNPCLVYSAEEWMPGEGVAYLLSD